MESHLYQNLRFYYYKNVINYLKGVLTEEGKKNGAMYAMFDYIIKSNAQTGKVFDFGGSDIEGVATFYKKFGAYDNSYYSYEKNHLCHRDAIFYFSNNLQFRFLKNSF